MNWARLSRRATSRTPSSPIDALVRLCVRGAGGSPAFPLATSLSSTISAALPLFDGFLGTTDVSDFSAASMAGLRLPFPAPPGLLLPGTVETSQFLCKKLPDMLRVFDRAGSSQGLRLTPHSVSPSAYLYSVGIPGLMISRLNGWPVVSPVNASLPASRRPTH
ncbi:conserved hypothetical protein [Pseudomonas sp. 8Z]|nr:conserved hypothetical protein [Pseudomonas sp. 8Z]